MQAPIDWESRPSIRGFVPLSGLNSELMVPPFNIFGCPFVSGRRLVHTRHALGIKIQPECHSNVCGGMLVSIHYLSLGCTGQRPEHQLNLVVRFPKPPCTSSTAASSRLCAAFNRSVDTLLASCAPTFSTLPTLWPSPTRTAIIMGAIPCPLRVNNLT